MNDGANVEAIDVSCVEGIIVEVDVGLLVGHIDDDIEEGIDDTWIDGDMVEVNIDEGIDVISAEGIIIDINVGLLDNDKEDGIDVSWVEGLIVDKVVG